MIAETPHSRTLNEYLSDRPGFTALAGVSERSQTPAVRPAPAAALTQEKSPRLRLDLLYMGSARPREPSMEMQLMPCCDG